MSDMTAFLNDLSYIPLNNEQNKPTQGDIGETSNDLTQAKCNEFEELYVSANEELYPGCDYVTRLDFMAKFTYFKVKGKLTDSIFNEMLELFQNIFPTAKGYKLPPSYYAIKKTFKTIGLWYESIHACVNDCFLFRGDANKDVHFCPMCNTGRWKDSNTLRKKVPKKVLRYFPIISRLQHLYKSSHAAKEMTWHATGKCTKPGKMQHPVDGRAWKDFDTKRSDFAVEPRNVRLGLAIDGFNLFGNLSQSYSIWPVILTTYNLPPWLCMKESSFMLTLLIPGPKSPGKDIYVYLRPLIDDLKDLWVKPGVETMDVATGQKFNMRAMVLWTINDFLARSSLSGHCQGKTRLEKPGHSKWLVARPKKTGSARSLRLRILSHQRTEKSFRVLPYGLQQYMPSDVEKPLIELCLFFKQICSQTLMVDDMLKAQSKMIDILCNLELIYPLAFFDIMIHLVIHLPLEAIFGGPIRPRWIEFLNKDMKEEFLGWFGKQIRQRHVDNDPGVNESSELFALACGPQRLQSQSTLSNNITHIKENDEAFKNDQYIRATQVKQCFYLEDMARRPLGWKVVEHVSHKKISNGGVIVVEDDPDVIHVDNSSDLALSTSLNELEIAALHIDGQSIDVDAPLDIIDVVDEDDDIIDEEDPIPHDLADSNDEDLVNLDIDDSVNIVYSNVARGHGGDDGGDDRKGIRKPNLGGRKAGRLHTRQETRNLELKAITDKSGPANYLGELEWELPLHYPSWRQMPSERKAGVVANIGPSLTCVPTWNPTAGHKSMRASSSTCKRSTMARRLLSKKDIGFLKRTRLMT
nr:hypothetical protein [Tanacetum cinerariifolium]